MEGCLAWLLRAGGFCLKATVQMHGFFFPASASKGSFPLQKRPRCCRFKNEQYLDGKKSPFRVTATHGCLQKGGTASQIQTAPTLSDAASLTPPPHSLLPQLRCGSEWSVHLQELHIYSLRQSMRIPLQILGATPEERGGKYNKLAGKGGLLPRPSSVQPMGSVVHGMLWFVSLW